MRVNPESVFEQLLSAASTFNQALTTQGVITYRQQLAALPSGGKKFLLALLEWYEAGASVFFLTHSLAAALALTEIPGYEWPADIKLPFASFAVDIPAGLFKWNQGWLRQFIIDGTDDRVMVVASRDLREAIHLEGDPRATVSVIYGVTADLHQGAEPIGHSPLIAEDDDIRLLNAVIRRLAAGVCSWLMSLPPEHPVRKQVRQVSLRSERSVSRPINIVGVGREVKLSRELRQAATDLGAAANGTPRPGWKLQFRHVVRGHFRNQAFGLGHTLRRKQWIAPFWKGPSDADAWAHVYKADEED